MKNCYVDKETNSIADLSLLEDDDLYLLTRINVPRQHRGKGHGSKLLRRILEDADRERSTIVLEIAPSDGLNHDQLKSWYERHGFVYQERRQVWERRPQR